MAKPELGTKRVCPETGRKFYDLNKDPVVSPYTGVSYPLSYFQDNVSSIKEEEEDVADEKELDDEEAETEIVSLEDADEDDSTGGAKGPVTEKVDVDDDDDDDDDIDLGDDDDDPFLGDDEDEDDDDDVTGIIGGVNSDDDE
ncbi:TIGR02300 family protein [Zhengella sp. ZM62]|uniref:TIGR02300 family protein n=1 Tax=Zhengella sedimenti TaxID=3390035 RepID=UPI003976CACE